MSKRSIVAKWRKIDKRSRTLNRKLKAIDHLDAVEYDAGVWDYVSYDCIDIGIGCQSFEQSRDAMHKDHKVVHRMLRTAWRDRRGFRCLSWISKQKRVRGF